MYRLPPKQIYMLEEEGRSALGVKGMKAKNPLTAIPVCNDSGSIKLPLSIIGHAKDSRCFRLPAALPVANRVCGHAAIQRVVLLALSPSPSLGNKEKRVTVDEQLRIARRNHECSKPCSHRDSGIKLDERASVSGSGSSELSSDDTVAHSRWSSLTQARTASGSGHSTRRALLAWGVLQRAVSFTS